MAAAPVTLRVDSYTFSGQLLAQRAPADVQAFVQALPELRVAQARLYTQQEYVHILRFLQAHAGGSPHFMLQLNSQQSMNGLWGVLGSGPQLLVLQPLPVPSLVDAQQRNVNDLFSTYTLTQKEAVLLPAPPMAGGWSNTSLMLFVLPRGVLQHGIPLPNSSSDSSQRPAAPSREQLTGLRHSLGPAQDGGPNWGELPAAVLQLVLKLLTDPTTSNTTRQQLLFLCGGEQVLEQHGVYQTMQDTDRTSALLKYVALAVPGPHSSSSSSSSHQAVDVCLQQLQRGNLHHAAKAANSAADKGHLAYLKSTGVRGGQVTAAGLDKLQQVVMVHIECSLESVDEFQHFFRLVDSSSNTRSRFQLCRRDIQLAAQAAAICSVLLATGRRAAKCGVELLSELRQRLLSPQAAAAAPVSRQQPAAGLRSAPGQGLPAGSHVSANTANVSLLRQALERVQPSPQH